VNKVKEEITSGEVKSKADDPKDIKRVIAVNDYLTDAHNLLEELNRVKKLHGIEGRWVFHVFPKNRCDSLHPESKDIRCELPKGHLRGHQWHDYTVMWA